MGFPSLFRSAYAILFQIPSAGGKDMNERSKEYLRWGILALALASCVFGALRGETADVLQKAAAICLECCGIG